MSLLEVIYTNPLPVGAIIASTLGMIIGLGVLIGTTVLIKQNKIKPLAITVFYLLSVAIVTTAIWSLVNVLNK